MPEVVCDALIASPTLGFHALAEKPKRRGTTSDNRIPWAALLKRVFANDVLVCGRCGGAMRILSFITNAAVAAKILDHLEIEMPRATGPPAGAIPLQAANF